MAYTELRLYADRQSYLSHLVFYRFVISPNVILPKSTAYGLCHCAFHTNGIKNVTSRVRATVDCSYW